MFYEETRIKQGHSYISFMSIKDSLQQQIHFNGNIFGNKCCRCNEGSLYSLGALRIAKESRLNQGEWIHL